MHDTVINSLHEVIRDLAYQRVL